MAELPWLAAGLYVPILFFWSQAGFVSLCTVVVSLHGIVFAICVRAQRCTGLRCGRWPRIKIVATSGLVDVGEKDLPQRGRF
jgi:hypothetical protein